VTLKSGGFVAIAAMVRNPRGFRPMGGQAALGCLAFYTLTLQLLNPRVYALNPKL